MQFEDSGLYNDFEMTDSVNMRFGIHLEVPDFLGSEPKDMGGVPDY